MDSEQLNKTVEDVKDFINNQQTTITALVNIINRFDSFYKECSVEEMIDILKNKGVDDMKNKDFQVCVPNVGERDNMLDIAEKHGWDVAKRRYWIACEWIVVYLQRNEIHCNHCQRTDVETRNIGQALDIIRRLIHV